MRKAIAVLLLLALSTALVSCTLTNPATSNNERVAAFTVKIVSPTKIVVDGRASNASHYTWHFDDGTKKDGGPEVAVYSHEYAEPNVYVVRLVAKWDDGGGEGDAGTGNDGGCCGPMPGPGPVNPGSGSAGSVTTASAYQVVDLLEEHGITPILIMWAVYGPSDSFYPGEKVCFDLSQSIGEDLVYWVEVVRVVSREDPTPIPYSWAGEEKPRDVEYIRWTGERHCIYVQGPGLCSGEIWTFRVTVRATDRWGRSATLVKFFTTGCCP